MKTKKIFQKIILAIFICFYDFSDAELTQKLFNNFFDIEANYETKK